MEYQFNDKAGVLQVLGTFITEWAHGKEQCASLLADMPTADRAARQLAAIASYYKFEGWLINIENELPEESIPTLLYFLRCAISASLPLIMYLFPMSPYSPWVSTLRG